MFSLLSDKTSQLQANRAFILILESSATQLTALEYFELNACQCFLSMDVDETDQLQKLNCVYTFLHWPGKQRAIIKSW